MTVEQVKAEKDMAAQIEKIRRDLTAMEERLTNVRVDADERRRRREDMTEGEPSDDITTNAASGTPVLGGVTNDFPTATILTSESDVSLLVESKSQGGVSLIAQGSFSAYGDAILGEGVNSGYGVYGYASGGQGVVGYSQTGVGVTAISDGNYAITANSAGGATLLASNNSPTGADCIIAIADNGIGVVAMGSRAPLLLFPTTTAGAPRPEPSTRMRLSWTSTVISMSVS